MQVLNHYYCRESLAGIRFERPCNKHEANLFAVLSGGGRQQARGCVAVGDGVDSIGHSPIGLGGRARDRHEGGGVAVEGHLGLASLAVVGLWLGPLLPVVTPIAGPTCRRMRWCHELYSNAEQIWRRS